MKGKYNKNNDENIELGCINVILIIFFIFILITTLLGILPSIIFSEIDEHKEYNKTYVTNFKKYKSDFEAIEKLVLKNKYKLKEEHSFYIYDNKLYYLYNDKKDENKLTEKEVIMTKKQRKNLKSICKCFEENDGILSNINVNERQISFETSIEVDRFALIHTFNNYAPNMNYKNKDIHLHIKKIEKSWYTIKGKSHY